MDPYVTEKNATDNRVGDRAFLPKIARGLRRMGHMLAFIPGLGTLGAFGVAGGYIAEVSDSLIHGKLVKSAKQLVMGIGDTFVTGFAGETIKSVFGPAIDIPLLNKIPLVGGLFSDIGVTGLVNWAKEPLSLIATGKSAGELTRTAIGTALDAPEEMAERAKRAEYKKSLQEMPMGRTTGYAPAQVGWAPGMQQQMAVAAPAEQDRYWFDMEAQRRGANPEQAYKNYQQGNGEHVAALEEARRRGPTEQQLA